jgi:hypothetical protein
VLRVASFFPFHTTYWLNGHSFIEQELQRAHIGFRKRDNAFLAVEDVAALQAAADRLSPQIIRKQLDYWTFLLGPKFSKKERSQMQLSRFYAIAQIEYCRNFIFKRHFPKRRHRPETAGPMSRKHRCRHAQIAGTNAWASLLSITGPEWAGYKFFGARATLG